MEKVRKKLHKNISKANVDITRITPVSHIHFYFSKDKPMNCFSIINIDNSQGNKCTLIT